MKKRKILLYAILQLLVLTLTGCSDIVEDEQALADFESKVKNKWLEKGEVLQDYYISERREVETENLYIVDVTLLTEFEDVSYQKGVAILYQHNGETWEFYESALEAEHQWIRTPLKGTDEKNISSDIIGNSFVNGVESWIISENNVSEIEIKSRETNLEEKSDVFVVNVTIDDEVQEAKGQLVVTYQFGDESNWSSEWNLVSVEGMESFTVDIKEEEVFGLTDENIIDELAKHSIDYGKKTMTMNADEITDFVVKSQNSYEKNSHEVIQCSGVLSKPYLTFELDITMEYRHRGAAGWRLESIEMIPELLSVDLQGEWTGPYRAAPYDGTMILKITEMTEDWKVSGVYEYIPEKIDFASEIGSYYVSGTFDTERLFLEMQPGDWIVEPRWNALDLQPITAMFDVDEGILFGAGHHGYHFEAKK